MNVGILSETLNVFVAAFSGGFDRLRPSIYGLFHLLVTLDMLLFGVKVLFDLEPVKGGLQKLLSLSLWAYVIGNFDQLATALVDSLVQAGFTAAGQAGANPKALMNPSLIMDGFFEATQPIANHVLEVNWLSINGTYILFSFTLFSMLFAYFMLALTAFISMIEYYMALSIACILLPFGVLGPTRWIAMKPLSYFLACGLKLMVVAFLAAIGGRVLGQVKFAEAEPTTREMIIAVCVSGTLGMLSWLAPQRLAAGIMAGAASFSAGDVARHAVGAMSAANIAAGPLKGPTKAALKFLGKGALAGGAAALGGVGAAFGAARSAFQGRAAAAPPRPFPTGGGGIVPASPHVASAATPSHNGSSGARGPTYQAEFVETSAAFSPPSPPALPSSTTRGA
jgi:type IV secretion system protein TrbL